MLLIGSKSFHFEKISPPTGQQAQEGEKTITEGSSMQLTTDFLLALGVILLLGLAMDMLGRKTSLPRVSLLLLFGLLSGREALDLIPTPFLTHFEIIANMALLMVGFLIGGKLADDSIKQSLGQVVWISIIAALGTTALVCIGLLVAGVDPRLAILLGCIASATAPAATMDIIMESDQQGPFASLLLAVVALDDAWGLILFSLGLAAVDAMNGAGGISDSLFTMVQSIGGAVLLGTAIGIPASFLTGRIRPGKPMLTEALGIVFLCGGLALRFDVSFLIAAMTMGYVVAIFGKHCDYPFHAIEDVEWTFMVIFFVLAGATLKFSALKEISLLWLLYVSLRIGGKLVGSWIGCTVCATDQKTRKWMGLALLPQAGVAIGMALAVATKFPEYQQTILSVVISATIFFEIIGPVFSRLALKQAQED